MFPQASRVLLAFFVALLISSSLTVATAAAPGDTSTATVRNTKEHAKQHAREKKEAAKAEMEARKYLATGGSVGSPATNFEVNANDPPNCYVRISIQGLLGNHPVGYRIVIDGVEVAAQAPWVDAQSIFDHVFEHPDLAVVEVFTFYQSRLLTSSTFSCPPPV